MTRRKPTAAQVEPIASLPESDAAESDAAERDAAERDAAKPDAAVPAPTAGRTDLSTTVAETLERVDAAWSEFHALAEAFPRERVDEHIDRGWTRKQMLAHIAAWHDMTTDRLLAFAKTGEGQPLQIDDDVFNSRVARAAAGRTSGEVIDALDSSFRRLRRQIGLLEDEQLAQHDGWPAAVVAANTYDHYAEHRPDLELPDEEQASG